MTFEPGQVPGYQSRASCWPIDPCRICPGRAPAQPPFIAPVQSGWKQVRFGPIPRQPDPLDRHLEITNFGAITNMILIIYFNGNKIKG